MIVQAIALVNQKGGVTKTTSCVSLTAGLAQAGKKVLVPQSSLTISLGHPQPDRLPVTLADMMGKVLNDQPITPREGILHHPEGFDLMPADIRLSGMKVSLVNAMSRETVLRQYLDTVKSVHPHSAGLSAVPGYAHRQRSGSGQPSHHSCAGGVSFVQRSGAVVADGSQGVAADQPQAPDRRHPAGNGG